MIVLGVDTASRGGGVALLAGERPLGRELGDRGRHAEEILPAVLALLEEAEIGWDAVDLLAVNEGPGSFTGIRVGVSCVLGLAEARAIPAAGVGCLDILAHACYDATLPGTGSYIVSAADVRRGEVVMARFRVTDRGPVREGEGRLTPVEAAEPPPPGAVLAGDGAELLWKTVPGLSRWSGTGTQRAAAAARLGARARSTETMHSPEPRYARAADARPRRR